MKTLACRDAGFDCNHVMTGETVEDIMKQGADHAKSVHNMNDSDMTPEFEEKIKRLIRTT
jgi:predicted small metal-binding protein